MADPRRQLNYLMVALIPSRLLRLRCQTSHITYNKWLISKTLLIYMTVLERKYRSATVIKPKSSPVKYKTFLIMNNSIISVMLKLIANSLIPIPSNSLIVVSCTLVVHSYRTLLHLVAYSSKLLNLLPRRKHNQYCQPWSSHLK